MVPRHPVSITFEMSTGPEFQRSNKAWKFSEDPGQAQSQASLLRYCLSFVVFRHFRHSRHFRHFRLSVVSRHFRHFRHVLWFVR
ncbi:unnamed protein product [Rangifer tarandus platyrhynchus]|uniref:Uncharacterized protein n=1 Tax=Rangifer tarandus platyrhynchus TaxID=3082113 RepID=A0AC59ZZA5_RANTA